MANDHDSDDRKDLTRIEDLSEFLHEQNDDIDSQFESPESVDISELPPAVPDLFETETETETETEIEPEAAGESFNFSSEDNISEDAFSDTNFSTEEFSPDPFSSDLTQDPEEIPEEIQEELQEELQEEAPDNLQDEMKNDFLKENADSSPSYQEHISENFSEVKNFAQNFSYGKIQGGGNPPFSVILRNIKYDSDAEDIISLLREFALITEKDVEETKRAINYGSLLIPQISEYTAIVIAHKLRRYDLDIEVGLSDEVHPSKSGDQNPKGLVKKNTIKQNQSERVVLSRQNVELNEVIVTTSSSIPNYDVDKYLGVQTVVALIQEEELIRLSHVQHVSRDKSSHIYNLELPEAESLESREVFNNYQKSFSYLYDNLVHELKQKAFLSHAHAVMGIQFLITPMPFDQTYHVSCSGTLATLKVSST